MKKTDRFSPRVRFNWGFHAGANETLRHQYREIKPDNPCGAPYRAGYALGKQWAHDGRYNPMTTLSNGAWGEYAQAKKI